MPDRGPMVRPGRHVATAATVVASMKSLWALGVVGVISRGRIEQAPAKRKGSRQIFSDRARIPIRIKARKLAGEIATAN